MDEEYQPGQIEPKWQDAWAEAGVFESDADSSKPKFYCLEMYPYPSGAMHMGHVRNYSIGDAIARYRRARGFNVIYPIGFDSFGMPAENAAIAEGGHPREITERNMAKITAQIKRIGFSYDWRRLLMSHDPDYYRWNQWFFLKFFEKGLAYRALAPVNWCDDCNTVLANEQARGGRCWRCSSLVSVKEMVQWFLRITDYSDELLDGLEQVDYPENVRLLQQDWLGRSEGALIRFPVVDSAEVIETFTTRPDTIFGVTFVTIAPENPLAERLVAGTEHEDAWRELRAEVLGMSDMERGMLRDKKGVFLGKHATNPLSGEKVPIYAGNFVIATYGTGSVMAVPGHDQRDYDFAEEYGIPIRQVLLEHDGDALADELDRAFEGYGPMVNSSRDGFDGLAGTDAINAVIAMLEKEGVGHGTVEWKLRDWGISRQRYWGTPIPIIHCDECGEVPVPETDLPVELPDDVDFTGEGNPLETSATFLDVDCPTCGAAARRETDTMDTFVDSSWYFMRYMDASNSDACFDPDMADYWMNVDFYCGGIEHAQMHLIYARFWTKALRDLGLHSHDEPFQRLLCQGMVNAPTPFCEACKTTLHVEHRESGVCPHCGGPLGERSAKMSKSEGNTINPTPMVDKYGADTVRLFMLFAANPTAGMEWSDAAVVSNFRQLNTIWSLPAQVAGWDDVASPVDNWLAARFRQRQREWVAAMEDVELRVAVRISHYEFHTDLQWYRRRGGGNKELVTGMLRELAPMLHPATPHIAEELWEETGGEGLLAAHLIGEMGAEQEGDASELAAEQYLRSLLEQARKMRGLAARHLEGEPSEVIIQCAESWKGELCRMGMDLQEEDFEMKSALKVIMTREFAHDAEVRKQIPGVWKRVRKQLFKWSPDEKGILRAEVDEVATITAATDFLASELGVDSVQVWTAGEGDDVGDKARFAFPLEPGIAYQ